MRWRGNAAPSIADHFACPLVYVRCASPSDVPNSGAFAGLCESSGAASMSSMIEQRRGLEVPDSQRRPKTFAAANSSIVDDTKPRDLFDLVRVPTSTRALHIVPFSLLHLELLLQSFRCKVLGNFAKESAH